VPQGGSGLPAPGCATSRATRDTGPARCAIRSARRTREPATTSHRTRCTSKTVSRQLARFCVPQRGFGLPAPGCATHRATRDVGALPGVWLLISIGLAQRAYGLFATDATQGGISHASILVCRVCASGLVHQGSQRVAARSGGPHAPPRVFGGRLAGNAVSSCHCRRGGRSCPYPGATGPRGVHRGMGEGVEARFQHLDEGRGYRVQGVLLAGGIRGFFRQPIKPRARGEVHRGIKKSITRSSRSRTNCARSFANTGSSGMNGTFGIKAATPSG